MSLTVLNFKRMGGLPGNHSDFTYKTYEVFRINKYFSPGSHTLEIALKGHVSGKEARKSVKFVVKPAESWNQKLRGFADDMVYGVVEVLKRILGLLGWFEQEVELWNTGQSSPHPWPDWQSF